MDALTAQALKSLVEKSLPQLLTLLSALQSADKDEQRSSPEIATGLAECQDLLGILQKWAGGHSADELDEDDQLISLMENDQGALGDPLAGSQTNLNPKSAEDSLEEEQELDDAEAAMLMQLESDDESTAENTLDAAESNEEMSDDEAALLLQQMDGNPSTSASDNESTNTDGEMSDDEARRLLEDMDGGNTEKESTSAAPSEEEMDDDEARRLLAEMDEGPRSDSETDADEMSAEDEAEALLANLGGDDEDPEEEVNQATATNEAMPVINASSSSNDLDEEIIEIEEWEQNDFQTDPDMIDDFNTNSEEIMETLDEQLLNLEQDPSNKEIIEEIFRAAHTLKGAAGMFGFKGLERVMHRMENLFDLIRKNKLSPSSDIVDVMFEGLDIVKELLEAPKKGSPGGTKTAPIVTKLTLVAMGKNISTLADSPTTKSSDEPNSPTDGASDSSPAQAKEKPGAQQEKKKEASTIRVDLNRLDALVNLVGELVIDRTRFVTIEEELRTNHPNIKLSGNISETVQLFGRHMNEIQDIIMKVRMVPIGNAFNKYPRIVRDLAKQLGKKIDLQISGENAEMDKTLVEQIGDPLIHLIRNSCDHGIESPDTRKDAGKNPQGTIWLSAHQEGNHIVITIEDDGKGIPAEVIRKKGVEKGLISEDDKLTNREIFNLIFEPGFSTAEKVTNVSGRGVGMDVVKKQIMKLKGMLEVDSEQGRGTTITIRLPLTLAIVQSLLVRVKTEIFAIPLGSVIESIRIAPEEIQKIGDSEVIKLRDKVLPLMHLDSEMNLVTKQGTMADYLDQQRQAEGASARIKKHEKLFVVVVGQADRPFGLLVHQLLNQQEMVIKSMGRLMNNISYVAGGAVLGNGEVVLVLDIPELEQSFSSKNRGLAA